MASTATEGEDVFKPFNPTDEVNDESKNVLEDFEEFDPFQVGTSGNPKDIKKANKTAGQDVGTPAVEAKANAALPPRMEVKFKIHEEVSSIASVARESEGSSEVSVEGTVLAQVTSSDAMKNAPFILLATSPSGAKVGFSPNETFAQSYVSEGATNKVNVIKIPKATVGFVSVGKYKFGEHVTHMPMLLERKISRAKAKVQVALQVRSKLSNPADLEEFSIALSISDKVDSNSIEINVGNGEWDRMTRTVVWKLNNLPRGESFMVSVRARLTEENAELESPELQFPVMMRCICKDQISSAEFRAIEASGYPATVSSSTIASTYRIIHRLE